MPSFLLPKSLVENDASIGVISGEWCGCEQDLCREVVSSQWYTGPLGSDLPKKARVNQVWAERLKTLLLDSLADLVDTILMPLSQLWVI